MEAGAQDGPTLLAPPRLAGPAAPGAVDHPADDEAVGSPRQQQQVGFREGTGSSSASSRTCGGSSSSVAAPAAPLAGDGVSDRGGSDEMLQDGDAPQRERAADPSQSWYDWLGTARGFEVLVKTHILLDMLPGFLATVLSLNCYEWANAKDSIGFDSTLTQYLRWAIFLRLPVLGVIMTACEDLVKTRNWKAADHKTFHVCRHRLLLIAAISAPISFKTLASPLIGGGCIVDEKVYAACTLVAPIYNLVLGVLVIMATLSSLRRVLPIHLTCQLQDLPDVPDADAEGGELSCMICLDKLEADNEVTQLTCLHIFHRGCIDPWLGTHYSCPLRCQADQEDAYFASS